MHITNYEIKGATRRATKSGAMSAEECVEVLDETTEQIKNLYGVNGGPEIMPDDGYCELTEGEKDAYAVDGKDACTTDD